MARIMALALVCAAVIAALAMTTLAQITTTGIRGIVRDQSGAVIPQATIKLTDTSTGIEHSTISFQRWRVPLPNSTVWRHTG